MPSCLTPQNYGIDTPAMTKKLMFWNTSLDASCLGREMDENWSAGFNFFSSGFWDSSLNWLLSFMLLLDLSASSFALVFAEHEAKYGMDQPR